MLSHRLQETPQIISLVETDKRLSKFRIDIIHDHLDYVLREKITISDLEINDERSLKFVD